MNEQELVREITSLQARMNRMERLMQQLLSIQTTSGAQVDKMAQMQSMAQELLQGSNIQNPASNPSPVAPQEHPEMGAIRQALLAGNKMKAIQLYRSLYRCSLQEAQAALDKM